MTELSEALDTVRDHALSRPDSGAPVGVYSQEQHAAPKADAIRDLQEKVASMEESVRTFCFACCENVLL